MAYITQLNLSGRGVSRFHPRIPVSTLSISDSVKYFHNHKHQLVYCYPQSSNNNVYFMDFMRLTKTVLYNGNETDLGSFFAYDINNSIYNAEDLVELPPFYGLKSENMLGFLGVLPKFAAGWVNYFGYYEGGAQCLGAAIYYHHCCTNTTEPEKPSIFGNLPTWNICFDRWDYVIDIDDHYYIEDVNNRNDFFNIIDFVLANPNDNLENATWFRVYLYRQAYLFNGATKRIDKTLLFKLIDVFSKLVNETPIVMPLFYPHNAPYFAGNCSLQQPNKCNVPPDLTENEVVGHIKKSWIGLLFMQLIYNILLGWRDENKSFDFILTILTNITSSQIDEFINANKYVIPRK